MELSQASALRLVVALAVGLLIGAERERRRATRPSAIAGLRTFGLVGFLGGLFQYLGPPALVITGAALIGLSSLTAYVANRDRDEDRGFTTEIALVVTYGLGVLAMSQPLLSAAWAVIIAFVLALRGWLHKLLRETLTEDELRDALVFLLATLVLLPIVPDVFIGPYGAINPQSLARFVCVLMAITGGGYVAQRLLGPRYGLTIAGFTAGFISSSATIASLGLRARAHPAAWRSAAAGALASSVATVVQYAVVLSAIDLRLLDALKASLGFAMLAACAGTALFNWLDKRAESEAPARGRAFQLWAALGFAVVVAGVSVLSAALESSLGKLGLVLVSGLAALVDAHSTTGSVASLHAGGHVDTHTAKLAVMTALSSNTLTKIVLACSGRHVKYALSVSAGVLAIAGAGWLGFLVDG